MNEKLLKIIRIYLFLNILSYHFDESLIKILFKMKGLYFGGITDNTHLCIFSYDVIRDIIEIY